MAYANNNPVRYNDPTGHDVGCGGRDASECGNSLRPVQPPGYTTFLPIVYSGSSQTNSNSPTESLNGGEKNQNEAYMPVVMNDSTQGTTTLDSADSSNQQLQTNDETLPSPNDVAQDDIKNQGIQAHKDKTGQKVAGAVLILVTDLFVGLPAAAVIISTGGVTPPAVAAEALEIFVVLPINILGIYLIADALEP